MSRLRSTRKEMKCVKCRGTDNSENHARKQKMRETMNDGCGGEKSKGEKIM